MKIGIPGGHSRTRVLFSLSVSAALGIILLLLSAGPASAEVISLSCSGNGYVRFVWLNLERGEVQDVMSPINSAFGEGGTISDALIRARKGELQSYSLTVTGDTYKWAAGSGGSYFLNRMTGTLRGPNISEQCSRAAVDPPATKF